MILPDRFWSKVRVDLSNGACWHWTGALTHGYGRFRISTNRAGYAHRLAYEALVGPIPHGLELDHTCRSPSCVNPAHLEPVTHAENVRRGDAPSARSARSGLCQRGHRLEGWNVMADRRRRTCRTCFNANAKARRIARERGLTPP